MFTLSEVVSKIQEKGYVANIQTVVKDGVEREALVIGKQNVNLMATLYPDKFPLEEMELDEAVDAFLDIALDSLPDESMNIDTFVNWEWVAPRLVYCLRQVTDDRALRKPFLDVEAYVRLEVEVPVCNTETHMASTVVSEELAGHWGKTANEIFEQALENCNSSYMLKDMCGVLTSLTDEDIVIPDVEMFVVTNDKGLFGASALANATIMKQVSRVFGHSFYIIPSSIHELLVIPTKLGEPKELKQLVRLVNETEVAPNEVLSNSLYHYLDGDITVL